MANVIHAAAIHKQLAEPQTVYETIQHALRIIEIEQVIYLSKAEDGFDREDEDNPHRVALDNAFKALRRLRAFY